MNQATPPEDALSGWDPRRRAALQRVWQQFDDAGASGVSLGEELIAERRREAAAEAGPASPGAPRGSSDRPGRLGVLALVNQEPGWKVVADASTHDDATTGAAGAEPWRAGHRHPLTDTDRARRSRGEDRRSRLHNLRQQTIGYRTAQRTSSTVDGVVDSRKVTITLPVTTVEQVRKLVDTGQALSISGFVQHAVAIALDDVIGWASTLDEAPTSTGGELSAQERAWADGVLDLGRQSGTA